tara:strand:+ start:227 stop:652 length:426 start_codon:yes stop_codon:yes gene_type:complete
MFDLVADIESYPYFIPWCSRVKIVSRIKDELKKIDIVQADMSVSFKVFNETFSSRVSLDRLSSEISVEYLAGPFKFLNNKWNFNRVETGCKVDFYVEFEFKSRILQRLIGVVFNEAMRRIVLSFEKRAHDLYSNNYINKIN